MLKIKKPKERHISEYERLHKREKKVKLSRKYALRLLFVALIFGLAAPIAAVILIEGASIWFDYNAVSHDNYPLLIFAQILNLISTFIQSVGLYLALLTAIISVGVFGLRKNYAWYNVGAQVFFSLIIAVFALYTRIFLIRIDRSAEIASALEYSRPYMQLLLTWLMGIILLALTVGIAYVKSVTPRVRAVILIGIISVENLMFIGISAVANIKEHRSGGLAVGFQIISQTVLIPVAEIIAAAVAMYFLGKLLMKKLDPSSQENL